MKKISKKIVALATMAAFVLTLVPAAAFAAATGDPNYSSVQTVLPNPDAAINEDVVLEASVYESDNETASSLKPVRVWAEDSQGRVTKSVQFYSVDANGDKTGSAWPNEDGVVNETVAPAFEITDGQKFIANFSVEGTYTVHVGQQLTQPDGSDKVVEVNYNEDYQTITVAPRTADKMTFTKENGGNLPTDKNVVTLDILNNFSGFEVNGVDTLTIKGHVVDENGKVVRNEKVALSADKQEIALTKTETTTDNQGNFNVTFKLSDFVNGNITVTCGDVTYTLKVVADKANASTIATTHEDGYVLAGNDKLWNQNEYHRVFGDAVQFEIKDQKGEVVTGNGLATTEPAFGIGNVTGYQHEDFVSIENKPAKSTLTAGDLIVVWDDNAGAYTLKYKSAAGQAAKDLVPGEYTVSVALRSGDNAYATFNVAKYGTTKDLVVTTQAKPVNTSADNYYPVDDEIALGEDLRVNAFYVDENGIKVPAKNAEYGADGKAVIGNYNGQYGKNIFQLKANSTVNESLIGTTIDVKVYDDTVKKLVEKQLTVVDAYDTYTLAFDPTEGEINKDNTVDVSVVDADDNLANKVDGTMYAYVADQSNKDAKVTVTVDKNADNGKGALTVYSDKETTADIVVAVKSGAAIYASTLEYTFGKEDPYADKSVVMTIGTTDYVVNNEIVKGDAAPYVDSAWRTMVPIRVLAETLGGTVDFKDNVVTIVDGDTTIAMTIGEKTYKVNDKEAEMDTAPVIGSGDRTYVPIRFVAEALGYSVTPLYDGETGTTASVVFQK